MISLKYKNEKGFTLIEALVSVALILIAVVGPLSLTINSISNITQNKNRMTASYLAEEPVESLKAKRDGFILMCRDLHIERDESGNPISGSYCGNDNKKIFLSQSMINNLDTGAQTSEQIGWAFFLDYLNNILGQESHIDRNSFDYSDSLPITDNIGCSYLYLNPGNTYSCSPVGDQTFFIRRIFLEKSSPSSIQATVYVQYKSSYLFGIGSRSVKIVQYIYER